MKIGEIKIIDFEITDTNETYAVKPTPAHGEWMTL